MPQTDNRPFDASLLVPMLYHLQLNNPIWPDAQPYDSYLFIAVAVVVVVVNRRRVLSRVGAPTNVLG